MDRRKFLKMSIGLTAAASTGTVLAKTISKEEIPEVTFNYKDGDDKQIHDLFKKWVDQVKEQEIVYDIDDVIDLLKNNEIKYILSKNDKIYFSLTDLTVDDHM